MKYSIRRLTITEIGLIIIVVATVLTTFSFTAYHTHEKQTTTRDIARINQAFHEYYTDHQALPASTSQVKSLESLPITHTTSIKRGSYFMTLDQKGRWANIYYWNTAQGAWNKMSWYFTNDEHRLATDKSNGQCSKKLLSDCPAAFFL